MSIRQGSNIISGSKSKELGLLTPQWFDYVLDDINWIRADSFSWHKGTIYTATYQHLLKDIDGKTTQTETIEGTTITFYLADDGHKIVDRSQEAAVQTIYENTGISWYYIIDRNNSLFKLPRSRFDIYGGSQVQAENMCLYFYAGNFAQSLDENNPTSPITGETNWGEIGGILSDQTDLQNALDEKAFLTDIGDATLTIQKNATTIDTFTANSKTDKTINIVVPTTPQEVNALPDTTKYAANVSMTIDSSTYVVTLQLKDQDGSNIGTAQTIDLPLESVVVSGRYDSANKKIILTLQDGSTIDIPVADLIAGLQSEITSTNKLDADLVDDTTSAHKFVTASDKSTWNAKQDAISDLSTIRSNASAGKSASDTIATYGDIVTHDVSEFATSTQGGKADTAIQPGDNISELTNDAAYVQTLADLGITATAEELNALDGVTASVEELNILDGATVTTAELNVLDGITASTTELNYTDGVTSNIQDQLDDKVAKNAAITGATKTKITYDSKGLVTAGDDLSESDIPSLHMSKISDVTVTATELNYVGGVTSAIQTQIDSKVDKTSGANKVYGTDENGDQTTYDYNTFGKVDDVKVGDTSVVTNKIANLGTMAGETATNYYTKVAADGTFVKVNPTITGATKTKITYDAKGLVTAGDDLAESDIPSIHLSKVSDVTATAAEVNVLDGITASTAELNILDGVTASTAELNILDGVTATTTELNYVDGVTSSIQDQLDDKVAKNADITGATKTKITYDSKGLVTAGADLAESDIPSLHLSKISDVTATAVEVNVLDGITATTTELNYVDGVTSSIQEQLDDKVAKNDAITGATKTKITYDSKGLVTAGADLAESDIPSIHLSKVSDVTASAAELNVLDGITATTTELNYVDGVTSSIQTQIDSKQATISDLADIRSGAAAGATAVQPEDLATVATTGAYADLTGTPTIGNATLTIQKNGTDIDTFTANATVDQTINITVPTQASDVNALPDTTKYAASASLSINSSTYVITLQLKDQDGNNIGTAQTIDLPLESVVVSGSYDSSTKEVVLTLQDGSTIRFSVADLVSGLQSEITTTNKLDADLVDDSTSTNKFVTTSDKTTWNAKQDAIIGAATTITSSDLTASKVLISNASGKVAASTVTSTELGYISGVTSAIQTQIDSKQATISDLATIRSGAAAGATALQPNTAITGATKTKITYDSNGLVTAGADLTASDIPSITLSKISDITATAAEVNVLDGVTATTAELNVLDGITASTTELNYVDGVTSSIQTQIDSKQATLVSGTNIKTINSTSLLGSGNITIHEGTYDYSELTNRPQVNSITLSGNKTSSDLGLQDTLVSGTNIKTINNNSLLGSGNITIDSLPTQTGNSGKFLTTNGTAASWAVVDALPSQTGQSGKVLTTNGTAASWMDSPGATIRIWGENE